MERKSPHHSQRNQVCQGKDAHLLRLLQILFSPKDKEMQQESAPECFRLKHGLLPQSTLSPSNSSISIQHENQDVTTPKKTGKSEKTTANSETDKHYRSDVSLENKTKLIENKEESSIQYEGQLDKRKRASSSAVKVKKASKQMKSEQSGTIEELETHTRGRKQTNKHRHWIGGTTKVEDSNNDVHLARRMLNILMYPPSVHHQRSVLAVLKSDRQLRTVFNQERKKIGKARIPVFKRYPRNANAAITFRSEAEHGHARQRLVIDKDADVIHQYSQHKCITPSTVEEMSKFPAICMPSKEDDLIQQIMKGDEITTPLGQHVNESCTHFTSHESIDTFLGSHLHLHSSSLTGETGLHDNEENIQELSREIYNMNNDPNIPVTQTNHNDEILVNSITTPENAENIYQPQTAGLIESFLASIDYVDQMQSEGKN